jgi:hypothetical protein
MKTCGFVVRMRRDHARGGSGDALSLRASPKPVRGSLSRLVPESLVTANRVASSASRAIRRKPLLSALKGSGTRNALGTGVAKAQERVLDKPPNE